MPQGNGLAIGFGLQKGGHMIVLVVDGMGGGLGRAVVEALKNGGLAEGMEIVAVGTNSIATANMIKGGANAGATGENAIVYNARRADYIVGSSGIVIGNSMHGEISPQIASAISCADAHKILLPVSKCNATFLGTEERSLTALLPELLAMLKQNG
jgi:hypothetical protein